MSVFSTGQLPNLRARGPNCKHLGNSAREMNTQCFEVLGLGYCRTPSLCGILKPSRSLCTQQPKPKGDWASQSINQIQSIDWEGLKQPTKPIITSLDGTTAEQLTHTKRRALSLSLARGSPRRSGGRQMFGFTDGWGEGLEGSTEVLTAPQHRD